MGDNYKKLEKLGSGSYGDVYKGIDITSKSWVAMKKINLDLFENGFPKSYLREISILQSLAHGNIVKYIDTVWKENCHIYLIFEYMMNDLRTYMDEFANFGLTLAASKSYLYQIAKGLEFCHRRAILHRDLKPENLLIDQFGTIKIADFGLSRTFSIPAVRLFSPIVVTLWYRSPELLLGMRPYSCPLDVWALGCIFIEMMTGRSPFEGDSEIDQIQKIFRIMGTPSEENWPGVTNLPHFKESYVNSKPIGLDRKVIMRGPGFDLLRKMLIFDPNKRITARKILKHEYFAGFDEKNLYPPIQRDDNDSSFQ